MGVPLELVVEEVAEAEKMEEAEEAVVVAEEMEEAAEEVAEETEEVAEEAAEEEVVADASNSIKIGEMRTKPTDFVPISPILSLALFSHMANNYCLSAGIRVD